MIVNLWYCKDMEQWRWTLSGVKGESIWQEAGQRPELRDAMNDVANTVEFLINEKKSVII